MGTPMTSSNRVKVTQGDKLIADLPLTNDLADRLNVALGSGKRASWLTRLWWKIDMWVVAPIVVVAVIAAIALGVGAVVFAVRFALHLGGGG